MKTTSGLRHGAWLGGGGGGSTALRSRAARRHVVARGQLEEALHAGGGVLGALALVAVRKEHDDAGEQAPLGLAGGDELIDDASARR